MHTRQVSTYYVRKKKLNVTIQCKTMKKCLTLIILQKNPQKNIFQIGQEFLTIWKTNALLNLINHGADIDKTVYMLKIHVKQNINY